MEKNFRLRSKDAELEKLPGGRAAPYEEKDLCPHRVVRTWRIWNFLCGFQKQWPREKPVWVRQRWAEWMTL